VRGTVTRGTLYLGLQQIVAFLAMMALHVASGRYFGPEVYGLFFVVNAVITLLIVTFLSGIPHAVAKFTAEDTRQAFGILGRGFLIQCVLSVVLAVALASLAGPLARLLGNASYGPLLRIGALAIPLLALAHLFIHVLNGMQWFRRQALALVALNVFKTLAVLFALGYLKGGAHSAVWGLVAAAGLSTIVAGALCRHVRGGDGTSFPMVKLVRFGGQLALTYLAVAVWDQVDLLMLQSLGERAAEVGFLTAACALTGGLESIFFPLLVTLFPSISQSVAAGARADAAFYVRLAISYAFIIMCPLAFGSFFVAHDILDLFYGAEYLSAAYAIGPLVVATLFYILYEILDTFLRGSGQAALSFGIAGTLLLVHVALNFALIPGFQMQGVVVTMVITSGLAALVASIPVQRALDLQISWRPVVKIVFFSALSFVPFLLWHPQDSRLALVLAAGCLLFYVGMLVLAKVLTRDDWERIRELVHLVGPRQG
jgi:O-antigen/teichoic acid export membrane protein